MKEKDGTNEADNKNYDNNLISKAAKEEFNRLFQMINEKKISINQAIEFCSIQINNAEMKNKRARNSFGNEIITVYSHILNMIHEKNGDANDSE